jgi:hypothetical protein
VPRRRASSCDNCGAALPQGARFCPECGTRLEPAAEDTAVQPAPAQIPALPEPRRFGVALGNLRARAAHSVEALATRSRARRDVLRVRQELLELGGERERRLRELGQAVYDDDRKGTKRLRAELSELDARIERKEAEMATIEAEAQERIEQGRLEVQPTQMVEIPEPPSPNPSPDPAPVPEPGPPTPVPEPYPPPDEATPPEPARIPEPGPLGDAREKK